MVDKDSVWKEAIETYFHDFFEFFFPHIAGDIDFGKGYEFLDKEIKRILREAGTGKRYADILVKVYLRDGQEEWLLIHIEVQGYGDKEFSERMFVYNYRIFDRYRKEIISLAILTDPSPGLRPERYETARWGFRHLFEFPIVKLIDYKRRWEELEKGDNPFALIVMAYLKEIETNGDIDNRLFWKITLVKKLYSKGYKKEDILLLYRFIDWLILLPDEYNEDFHEEITKYEEEKKMPFITTAERIGIKKGKIETAREDIVEVLETRFGAIPKSLRDKIQEIEDEKILSSLHRKAVLVQDLEEFSQVMDKPLD